MSEYFTLLPPDKPTRSELIPLWENLISLIGTLQTEKPDIDGWTSYFLEHDTDLRPYFGSWNFRDLILASRWDHDHCGLRGWKPTWATALCTATANTVDELPGLPIILEHMCNLVADSELNSIGDVKHDTSHFVQIVPAMVGGQRFIRCLKHFEHLELGDYRESSGYDSESCIKTYLLRVSRPTRREDMHALAYELRKLNFTEDRLLQILSFNPLWAKAVAIALEQPDIDSLAWYYYLHGGRPWRDKIEKFPLAGWASLPEEAYESGALDVQWLDSLRERLTDAYITRFFSLAETCCSSHMCYTHPSTHNRLVYCTEAYLGMHDRATVFKRARIKRHQDSIHAIGLLPLAADISRHEDLSQRLQLLKDIRSTRKKVGAERQANEAERIEFAINVLAHQVKEFDAWDLWWKADAEEISLLSSEPLAVRLDDLHIMLKFDSYGLPALIAERKGKVLKAVPAAAKKDIAVAELVDRHKLLKVKHKDVVASLEDAMVSRVAFTQELLAGLAKQPLFFAIACRLIWLEEKDSLAGYPDDNFLNLINPATGEKTKLSKQASCRVAHPCELEEAGWLALFQRHFSETEIAQPFQQLEREYVSSFLNAIQRAALINELSGKQVEPLVLGGKTNARGWRMYHASEPLEFRRKFQRQGVTATLIMDGHFFDAQYDFESVSVSTVEFLKSPQLSQLPLDQVPAVVFSEALRDVRLFVSAS